MLNRVTLILLTLLLGSSQPLLADDANPFPFRKNYPQVQVIETRDLTAKFDQYTIVDVRSPFEFDIMRIKGAHNIPVAQPDFADKVKALHEKSGKPMVFYCNGHTCEKAYQAAIKARQMAKVEQAIAYDGGIFDWAKNNPKLTQLLDKPELDPKALIAEDKFKAHLLEPQEFIDRAQAHPAAPIIDLRDTFQSDAISLFATRDIRTGFDIPKLRAILNEAKQKGHTVFIYDAAGRQIKNVQYLVEDIGLKDYFFMKDGMLGYYAMIRKK
ncbi:MAG: rhodanese-like domain-containing protein [Gammaproteobacteria bacterium]|nr:rhodanese-like domain-containing protein [Gammaproteobacteria bacterium]